ncbi:CRIB domain-containing protein RIC7-like [Zingiber officinale]|uniref:CRIB domain-containing protein RIC7-like n=1 Tax=Zingiber officinale TaxID=94328 RepID=UPI001C4C440A|nr:CRIB domain-containing protein RIC7-like [Zingiber officinale]
MGTSVKKGILKPIRYISQMFDQKEPELQIGFPTDVKHVAHIGSDGPNTSDPGWMKDYHSAPLNPTCGTPETDSAAANTWGSQGSDFLSEGIEDSAAGDGGADSKPRHSRRHKSDDTPDMGAAADSADGGAKKGRRGRKKEAASAGTNADVPAIPKKSHRRRSKDEGSAKTSKSKAAPSAKSDAAAEAEKNSAPSAAAGGS